MKQRKTMKLWQMLTLAVLCLGMLINIFLPIWDFDGTKALDWMMESADEMAKEDVVFPGMKKETIQAFTEYMDDDKQEMLEKGVEQFDDAMEKLEEKIGIHICSLSAVEYVTMDANALVLSDKDYTEKDLEKIEEGSKRAESKADIIKGKWLLGAHYLFGTVLLILILLGFFLKWDKRIVSIISALYGCWGMLFYGTVWWGAPGYILKDIEDAEMAEKLQPFIESLWHSIVGIGVIVGFVLAGLFLAMGVISCFVGKTVLQDRVLDPFPNPHPFPDPFPEPFPEPFLDPRPEPRPEPRPDPVPIPSQPKSGRVKCTQGVALGQGFKLPEDRKIIVGKSPQNATLVIYDQHVSNIHCSIRYHAETDSYIVKDHSTNGTFVNGVRLGKDVAMEYPAGTVLSLANGTNKITLG